MASPSESKPQSYSLLLKSFVDQPDQSVELEDFLARLEKEWLKIEAFKRELPLCMQLLTNAMEASRQQLETYRVTLGAKPPVLEEFIPLKHSTSEGSEEKSSWMVSAQLWSQSDEIKKQSAVSSDPKEIDPSCFSPKLGLDDKKRNGGAFLPFTKERSACAAPALRKLSDLCLTPNKKEILVEEKKCAETDKGRDSFDKGDNNGRALSDPGKGGGNNQGESQAANSQTHRKARRCWSPDLHRRFVSALQMLGGSQVATPKQIRELMKVDGLTNDEVKSHLQKYRLHTRRPSPSHHPGGGTQQPQLVVLGSIWVPPEYAAAAHSAAAAAGPTIYSTHPASRYCAPPVPQDFYPAVQHHTVHHPHAHLYKTRSSPECDAGERSESIEEDGKSESGSWKGDSNGDNNEGERRGLASLRDNEGVKSHENEITLNF